MKRILIAEDQPFTLLGIRQPLGELYASVEITFATNRTQIVKCIEGQKFDLLIVDISKTADDKLEIIESARQTQPDIPVIICTGCEEVLGDECYAQLGVSGYVSKRKSDEDFKQTIRTVLNE